MTWRDYVRTSVRHKKEALQYSITQVLRRYKNLFLSLTSLSPNFFI